MRQKRNVKSESEEISIILFEHEKGRSQAEISIILFEHEKGRSQAESGRNIELSFRNAVLRIASLFGRNIEESLVMRFPKSQIFFQEISRKDFDPLLGQVDYDLWQSLAGKGDLCDLAPRQDAPEGRAYALRGT